MLEQFQKKKNEYHIISGILLLSGTCIGAGMLALPVVTGVSGFYPSLVINFICWLVMFGTGLLFLEATLWMDSETNLLSTANRFLGPFGKWIGGFFFLFLYYCLEVSYMAGGATILNSFLENTINFSFSPFNSILFFGTIFGLIIFMGTHVINRINWILVMGLVISYILLIFEGSQGVQAKLLLTSNWKLSIFAIPTLFCAYGYHNIIPSLCFHFKKDEKKMGWIIFIGTFIPFIIYSIWQWMIIGTVPQEILIQSANEGVPISQTLQEVTGRNLISVLSAFFGFFALVTSLLGVSLSMVDFLADALQLSKTTFIKFLLVFAVFFPSTLFAAYNPHIFIKAINVAGGVGEAVLNGIFPVAMVWVGRYSMKLQTKYPLPGGKISLIFLFIFTSFVFFMECFHLIF